MRPRIPVARLEPGDIVLDDSASHHLGRVLRCQSGDQVTLFDGKGAEAEGYVLGFTGRHVRVRVDLVLYPDRESPLAITVVQSLCTGDKMDWVVEKCTELGARLIVPLAAARSVMRVSGERADRKREHWQAIARAASSQSGRSRIPVIAPVQTLTAWLDAWRREPEPRTGWLLDPFAGIPVSRSPIAGPLTIMIGPEAGWTDDEEDEARTAGFAGVRCGPRILRTETAAAVVLAAVAVRSGEF
jgi:16S rRNA (uracil1498-N3)-methyltransferase